MRQFTHPSKTSVHRTRCSLVLFILCCVTTFTLMAMEVKAEVYQSPEDFLSEIFSGQVPASKVIWLTGKTGETVSQILQHKARTLRWRYWEKDKRSVWITEETGKEKPITVGISVKDDNIEQVRVLVFRESRGWQIRYPFFTQQFVGARLTHSNDLDKPIDGISGATLSVRAVTRLSRAVLYLHQRIAE